MSIGRRAFCLGLGSAAAWCAGRRCFAQEADGAAVFLPADMDPAGGYTVKPPAQFLFTDFRHIDPGDLNWLSPEGAALPVAGPPDPPVPAVASLGLVARGIRLVAQRAGKEGPVDGLPGRVLHDGGLYRSWSLQTNYPAGGNLGSYSNAPAESLTVQYSESNDGYAWSGREVCRVPVQGVTGIDGDFVFIDPHGPAEERYKCIYNARVLSAPGALWSQYEKVHPRHRDIRLSADYIYCLFGMTSPDGVNWTPIPEPLLIHKGDTDNTVYYDDWLGKYVLYTRLYSMQRRMVARAESDDFRHWTPVEPVVWPNLEDPPSYDVYTNGRTCYPGLPEHHLMFPFYYRRYTQTSEVHLLSSIDGSHWDRVPGGPVIEPGDPGDWDGEFIVAGKGLVPLGTDRIAIPYSGSTHPHKYPRWPGVISHAAGWASWPSGRLSALVAGEEGEFCTFGVEVTGAELKVNANIRRAGELRVGLRGVEGRTAGDCDPLTGNETAHTITWRGSSSLGIEPGQRVCLHFRLRSAELFGFSWA
ncbi:MAG TPA: hypothetical protein PLJ71_18225 [Candidatus Hydrogenedentes bacterium]|nr:hypothetical protein [Candidatus Hydrogenedentota bacterium]